MVRRVAVIGAGAAGLAVLRRFGAREDFFEATCFEQLSDVGGLWNYCDNITDQNHPTGSRYTAIYKHMRTNLPRQVMLFEGCSYPDDLPSFISHEQVKDYLEKYADMFNLRKYIKFNQRIIKVDPKIALGREDVWTLRAMDVHTKTEQEYEFDIVIVCCGQYSVPYYPVIEGMDVFQGQMIHSQVYRDPEQFRGKRVLVVGGGPSGIDISIEISGYAEKTWLSHRKSESLSISKEVSQVGEISYLMSDSAVVCKTFDLEEKECLNILHGKQCGAQNETSHFMIGPIDVIMFSTGFYYAYPFLSADCGVAVLNQLKVGPLYKDLVCLSRPTLSFVGLLYNAVPFPLFDCQAQFLVALYEGRISSISCKEKMVEEMEEYNAIKRAHNVDVVRNPFKIPDFQWYYEKHLASEGGFCPPPHHIEDLFKKVWEERSADFTNYKKNEYRLGSDGLYVKV